jgi:hypothetical protein
MIDTEGIFSGVLGTASTLLAQLNEYVKESVVTSTEQLSLLTIAVPISEPYEMS